MKNYQFRALLAALLFGHFPLCSQETPRNRIQAAEKVKDAIAAEDSGQNKKAIEIFKGVLKLEPMDVRAMNSIAGLYGKLGKFKEELAWAERAIATNPDFDLAYINKGNALVQMKRLDEATLCYERASTLNPASPLGPYSLGVIAENRKTFPEAIHYYKCAIQIDPEFPDGYFNLAAVLANVKQFDEAISTLDKLLELQPGASDAMAMRKKLLKARLTPHG